MIFDFSKIIGSLEIGSQESPLHTIRAFRRCSPRALISSKINSCTSMHYIFSLGQKVVVLIQNLRVFMSSISEVLWFKYLLYYGWLSTSWYGLPRKWHSLPRCWILNMFYTYWKILWNFQSWYFVAYGLIFPCLYPCHSFPSWERELCELNPYHLHTSSNLI